LPEIRERATGREKARSKVSASAFSRRRTLRAVVRSDPTRLAIAKE
jgi:hypothetical protein